MNRFSSSSLVAALALALVALGTQGCAVSEGEPEDDVVQAKVVADDGELTPQQMGYVPRVTRADFRKPAGSCTPAGLCTANGTSWNCSGPGYCSRITE